MCARGRMDGWQLLTVLPITPPLSGDVEQGITPPPSLLLYHQPSTARRSESLRRFNYSPGEDDSQWLNGLEMEEEEEDMGGRSRGGEEQRMGIRGGGEEEGTASTEVEEERT